MSRSGRRPWETPITYNDDDRWSDPQQVRRLDDGVGGNIKPDPDLVLGRNVSDERPTPRPKRTAPLPSPSDGPRPDWRNNGGGRSNDDAPLNYNRGPHDREIDVDDRDEPD
jgi:hypothetical protein